MSQAWPNGETELSSGRTHDPSWPMRVSPWIFVGSTEKRVLFVLWVEKLLDPKPLLPLHD